MALEFFLIREEVETHMLNTLIALKAPEAHCLWYPSMVGFTESANLPMRGIVHLDPGR